MSQVIFTLLFTAAMFIFVAVCIQRFRLLSVGKPENRLNRIGHRIMVMLVFAFGQKRVVRKPYGMNHFVIFWAFLILLLANGEFIVNGIFPQIGFHLLPAPLANPLYMVLDIVSLLALVSILIAVVRRFVKPPYPGATTGEAFIILGLIGTLMIAFFSMHGAKIALEPSHGASMPISSLFSSFFFAGKSPESLNFWFGVWWWVHAVVLLAFLNYLPFSKHMHIIAAIPNVFFSRFERPNTMPREVFEKDRKFGADTIAGFTWKGLMDGYGCTECGRCQMACPAWATGKPLNPREIIHDVKINLIKNGPLLQKGKAPVLPLIGEGGGHGSISEDSIWSCTTCGACMEVCPVFIEQMPKIIDMRRHLVQMEAKFPHELNGLFESMEQRSNPWGIAPGDRVKWYSQLPEVKPFSADTEYLLYVGCAGAFDNRNKQVTVALAKVLDAAGVKWGVLGKDEMCCGDSLRRLGNEFVFEKIATANVKMLQDKGVKKIITICPHCFSTLGNDYRQFGLEAEVLHHSVLVDELLKSGSLKLSKEIDLGKTLYHDACYLGRHNGVYDQPRDVIARATGEKPSELDRNRSKSFCCGAGGGRMWMEENLGKRINHNRVDEAMAKKPDTVCVACPYCMTMFNDGLKDRGDDHIQVKNVVEVVAEAL